jgi:hypothetical protein
MRYEVRTRLTPDEAFAQALVHFGRHGTGLQLTTRTPQSLVFQGGGGHVALSVVTTGPPTTIELETREWDYAVQQFMAQVTRRRHWWSRWRRRKPPAVPPPPEFRILNNGSD